MAFLPDREYGNENSKIESYSCLTRKEHGNEKIANFKDIAVLPQTEDINEKLANWKAMVFLSDRKHFLRWLYRIKDRRVFKI